MTSPNMANYHGSSTRQLMRWLKSTTGSPRDVEHYRASFGAPSLEDAAIRCVLRNLDSIDHTHLSCVPWPLRKRIWAEVKRLRLDSLQTWKMFARAFAQEHDTFREHKKMSLEYFLSPMTIDYIFKQVTAPNFEWMVHLILEDAAPNRADWCNIKQVSNLASLQIYKTSRPMSVHWPYEASLDDRVVKSWATASQEEGAFSKLSSICFKDCQLITSRALQFLAGLPALQLCHFVNCAVDCKDARQYWHRLGHFRYLDDLYANPLNKTSFSRLQYPSNRDSVSTAVSIKPEIDSVPALTLYDRISSSIQSDNHKRISLLRKAEQQNAPEVEKAADEEPEPKKRKVRASKEQSIGNILGDMGC
ncbi:hypothetical protein IWZ01DRAFT_130997 [Phyllosticta capitalensis]